MKVLQYVFALQIIFLYSSFVYGSQQKNEATLYASGSQESFLSAGNIQKAMHNPHFASEEFPNNFSSLYGLLWLGKNVAYAPTFGASVFTTFRHVIHGSPYINAYPMRDLLRDLPDLLQNYLKNSTEVSFIESIRTSVNNLMYSRFTSEYASFRKEPEQFLKTIAGDIAVIVSGENNMKEFEVQLVRFLELAITKLVWSPEEYKESWELIKSMSNYLAILVDKNVLTDINYFNDLSWALVHRYAEFLGIFADVIPSSFYQEVRNEISKKDLILFQLDDNKHNSLESKYVLLNRKLFECEARSKAIEKGVILG